MTGETSGTFAGQTSAGGRDVFLSKFDAVGNELWMRQFGTYMSDYGYGVAADARGHMSQDVPMALFRTSRTPAPPTRSCASTTRMASEAWTRQFGSSALDQARSIRSVVLGVFVAGYADGVVPGGSQVGGTDAFLRKFDADGNEAWTRQFGTSSSTRLTVCRSPTQVSTSPGHTYGTFPGQVRSDDADLFVCRYATTTEMHSGSRQFGSSAYDVADAIAADSAGSLPDRPNPGHVSWAGARGLHGRFRPQVHVSKGRVVDAPVRCGPGAQPRVRVGRGRGRIGLSGGIHQWVTARSVEPGRQ